MSMMAQAREETMPSRIPFWFKPVSTFGLLFVTTRSERSLMLVVLIHPLHLSTFVLADSASPHGSTYRVYSGCFVPGASHQAVASFACPGRERLMEQPVSSGLLRSVKQRIERLCRSHQAVKPDRRVYPDDLVIISHAKWIAFNLASQMFDLA